MHRQECTWDPPPEIILENPLWPEKEREDTPETADPQIVAEHGAIVRGERPVGKSKDGEGENGDSPGRLATGDDIPAENMLLNSATTGVDSKEQALFEEVNDCGASPGVASSTDAQVRIDSVLRNDGRR